MTNDENLLTVRGIKRRFAYREQFLPRIKKEGSNYYVSVRSGYVVSRNLSTGVVPVHVTDTESPIGDTPVWKAISAGQTVYCRVVTDSHDVLTGSPSIVIGTGLTSTPATPKVGDTAAVAGDYHYALFKFEVTGGRAYVDIISGGAPIEHNPLRMWVENAEPTSSGIETHNVAESYTVDTATLKPIVQLFDSGTFKILGSVSTHEIAVKSLAHRESPSERGIEIEDTGRALLVKGTGFTEELTGVLRNAVIRDGIVVSCDTVDGWWGTARWEHFTNITDSVPYDVVEKDYEAGILTAVRYQGPGGGSLEDVAGTEGSPGSVTFFSFGEP